jgi:hypothetical protein
MFAVKREKLVEKFLLATTGSGAEDSQAIADRLRLAEIMSDPCNRIVEVKDEKETEKTANDKGIITSLVEHLYRVVIYERESI